MDRQKLKDEAIRRMKAMGYFEYSIKEFEKYDKIMVNERPWGAHYFADDEETYPNLMNEIREVEKNYGLLVYAVVRQPQPFGMIYYFLYVSKYEEEWYMFEDELDEYYFYTYAYNETIPEYSEFGSVQMAFTPAAGFVACQY